MYFMEAKMNDLIENKIENLVYEVRGVEVMLDSDLAMLYEVETKRINEAYYRNIDKSKIQFDFICDEDSTNIPYEEIERLGGRVILVPPYQKIFKYQKKLNEVFKKQKYLIVHSHINTLSIFPLRIAKKNKIQVRIAHSHSTNNKAEWKKNLIKNIDKYPVVVYNFLIFRNKKGFIKWQMNS